jgi:hypothetical protein
MDYDDLFKIISEEGIDYKPFNGIRMLNNIGDTLMVSCNESKVELSQKELMGEKFVDLNFGDKYSKACHWINVDEIKDILQ